MSNEFDIEKAKAGEPVERIYGAGWDLVVFVGLWDKKQAVCRIPGNSWPELIPLDCLQMAPKTVKVRFRPYLKELTAAGLCVLNVRDDNEAEFVKRDSRFRGWLTEWQEVEIQQ